VLGGGVWGRRRRHRVAVVVVSLNKVAHWRLRPTKTEEGRQRVAAGESKQSRGEGWSLLRSPVEQTRPDMRWGGGQRYRW